MTNLFFNPGLNIEPIDAPLGFELGDDIFAPTPEVRTLDSVRASLREPECQGPQELYAIMMDVGRPQHRDDLVRRHLLFGVVTYASGQLGREPIRSQGHIHAKSPRTGWSTPELYEIWRGKAVILMQERCEADNADPGRCYAVEAGPGDVVLVPPGWAHATISADPTQPLTFGAWCDRAYAFEYDAVRAHGGLAFFPFIGRDNSLSWIANETYEAGQLVSKQPRVYSEFQIVKGTPIYVQYEQSPGLFDFVPGPANTEELWNDFSP